MGGRDPLQEQAPRYEDAHERAADCIKHEKGLMGQKGKIECRHDSCGHEV
ncbi:hypothetical protein Amal_03711 [Acetobacter malorum]|uniref:Uncharacterized protein n=1 Tax=Acetobacter malorum TaxID=178901 RepID=A0A177G6Y5_9PROT|nr:hypothetical protein Amal_03711 [Acetobacter malorum]